MSILSRITSIPNEKCQSEVIEYLDKLSNFKLWAVQMFDATSKFPMGVLQGAAYNLGNFDECLDVDNGANITGRYCLARVEFNSLKWRASDAGTAWEKLRVSGDSRKVVASNDRMKMRRNVFYHGVCFPSSCGASDVEYWLNTVLTTFQSSTQTKFRVEVSESMCQKKDELSEHLNVSQVVWRVRRQKVLEESTINVGHYFKLAVFTQVAHRKYFHKGVDQNAYTTTLHWNKISTRKSKEKKEPGRVGKSCKEGLLAQWRSLKKRRVHEDVVLFQPGVFNEHDAAMPALSERLARAWCLYPATSIQKVSCELSVSTKEAMGLLVEYLVNRSRDIENLATCIGCYDNYLSRIAQACDEPPLPSPATLTSILKQFKTQYMQKGMTCKRSFSLLRNWRQLTKQVDHDGDQFIACIDGLRVYTLIIIIIGHRGEAITSGPLINGNAVEQYYEEIGGAMIMNGHLVVDTFFTIGGFVLAFEAWFLYDMSSGPLWKNKVGRERDNCLKNWWTNALHINNYVQAEFPITLWLGWVFSPLVAVAIIAMGYEFYQPSIHLGRFGNALYSGMHRTTFGACTSFIIVACATGNGGVVARILEWKMLRPFSRLSYSVFLVHTVVQMVHYAAIRSPEYMNNTRMFDAQNLKALTYRRGYLMRETYV
uniref:Nose resistant-to-fluoxetine protein N-terminal domain-containing protein n=1 Tax=Timema poppense TaxID=170557 RepID=A0A7R9CK13_TIMPO|nr:unnamed protein product [Timema poppensis]